MGILLGILMVAGANSCNGILYFFCRGLIASARDKRNSIIGGRMQYAPYKLNFLRPKLKMKARKITAEINDANFATRSPHFV